MEHLTKFYKGFHWFTDMELQADYVIFKTHGKVGIACDKARERINEMQLPLKAQITSYNTFTVELV